MACQIGDNQLAVRCPDIDDGCDEILSAELIVELVSEQVLEPP